MQHAGIQYGPGTAPTLQPTQYTPAENTPTVPTGSTTTSVLRSWRKKDATEKLSQAEPAAASAAESQGPVARVAPHAHYPKPPSDVLKYQQHCGDFGLQQHQPAPPVKYSEIIEPMQSLDHLPPVAPKPKEKTYLDMCNLQQNHMAHANYKQYQDTMKTYQSPMQYKDQFAPYAQKESQMAGYVQKDFYPYLANYKVPAQYPRSHQRENNEFLASLNKLAPQMAQEIMNDPHLREPQYNVYPGIDQGRLYQQQQQQQRMYQRTSPIHAPPGYGQRSVPQGYNQYAMNQRLQQDPYRPYQYSNNLSRYAQMHGHVEQMPNPQRQQYHENVPMNFAPLPPRISSNYPPCNQLEYAQHYQHRQGAIRQEFLSAPSKPAYLESHPEIPEIIPEESLQHPSKSLKRFLETWSEELVVAENAESFEPAPPEKVQLIKASNNNGENTFYVLESMEISSEKLPQYLHLPSLDKFPGNIKGFYTENGGLLPENAILIPGSVVPQNIRTSTASCPSMDDLSQNGSSKSEESVTTAFHQENQLRNAFTTEDRNPTGNNSPAALQKGAVLQPSVPSLNQTAYYEESLSSIEDLPEAPSHPNTNSNSANLLPGEQNSTTQSEKSGKTPTGKDKVIIIQNFLLAKAKEDPATNKSKTLPEMKDLLFGNVPSDAKSAAGEVQASESSNTAHIKTSGATVGEETCEDKKNIEANIENIRQDGAAEEENILTHCSGEENPAQYFTTEEGREDETKIEAYVKNVCLEQKAKEENILTHCREEESQAKIFTTKENTEESRVYKRNVEDNIKNIPLEGKAKEENNLTHCKEEESQTEHFTIKQNTEENREYKRNMEVNIKNIPLEGKAKEENILTPCTEEESQAEHFTAKENIEESRECKGNVEGNVKNISLEREAKEENILTHCTEEESQETHFTTKENTEESREYKRNIEDNIKNILVERKAKGDNTLTHCTEEERLTKYFSTKQNTEESGEYKGNIEDNIRNIPRERKAKEENVLTHCPDEESLENYFTYKKQDVDREVKKTNEESREFQKNIEENAEDNLESYSEENTAKSPLPNVESSIVRGTREDDVPRTANTPQVPRRKQADNAEETTTSGSVTEPLLNEKEETHTRLPHVGESAAETCPDVAASTGDTNVACQEEFAEDVDTEEEIAEPVDSKAVGLGKLEDFCSESEEFGDNCFKSKAKTSELVQGDDVADSDVEIQPDNVSSVSTSDEDELLGLNLISKPDAGKNGQPSENEESEDVFVASSRVKSHFVRVEGRLAQPEGEHAVIVDLLDVASGRTPDPPTEITDAARREEREDERSDDVESSITEAESVVRSNADSEDDEDGASEGRCEDEVAATGQNEAAGEDLASTSKDSHVETQNEEDLLPTNFDECTTSSDDRIQSTNESVVVKEEAEYSDQIRRGEDGVAIAIVDDVVHVTSASYCADSPRRTDEESRPYRRQAEESVANDLELLKDDISKGNSKAATCSSELSEEDEEETEINSNCGARRKFEREGKATERTQLVADNTDATEIKDERVCCEEREFSDAGTARVVEDLTDRDATLAHQQGAGDLRPNEGHPIKEESADACEEAAATEDGPVERALACEDMQLKEEEEEHVRRLIEFVSVAGEGAPFKEEDHQCAEFSSLRTTTGEDLTPKEERVRPKGPDARDGTPADLAEDVHWMIARARRNCAPNEETPRSAEGGTRKGVPARRRSVASECDESEMTIASDLERVLRVFEKVTRSFESMTESFEIEPKPLAGESDELEVPPNATAAPKMEVAPSPSPGEVGGADEHGVGLNAPTLEDFCGAAVEGHVIEMDNVYTAVEVMSGPTEGESAGSSSPESDEAEMSEEPEMSEETETSAEAFACPEGTSDSAGDNILPRGMEFDLANEEIEGLSEIEDDQAQSEESALKSEKGDLEDDSVAHNNELDLELHPSDPGREESAARPDLAVRTEGGTRKGDSRVGIPEETTGERPEVDLTASSDVKAAPSTYDHEEIRRATDLRHGEREEAFGSACHEATDPGASDANEGRSDLPEGTPATLPSPSVGAGAIESPEADDEQFSSFILQIADDLLQFSIVEENGQKTIKVVPLTKVRVVTDAEHAEASADLLEPYAEETSAETSASQVFDVETEEQIMPRHETVATETGPIAEQALATEEEIRESTVKIRTELEERFSDFRASKMNIVASPSQLESETETEEGPAEVPRAEDGDRLHINDRQHAPSTNIQQPAEEADLVHDLDETFALESVANEVIVEDENDCDPELATAALEETTNNNYLFCDFLATLAGTETVSGDPVPERRKKFRPKTSPGAKREKKLAKINLDAPLPNGKVMREGQRPDGVQKPLTKTKPKPGPQPLKKSERRLVTGLRAPILRKIEPQPAIDGHGTPKQKAASFARCAETEEKEGSASCEALRVNIAFAASGSDGIGIESRLKPEDEADIVGPNLSESKGAKSSHEGPFENSAHKAKCGPEGHVVLARSCENRQPKLKRKPEEKEEIVNFANKVPAPASHAEENESCARPENDVKKTPDAVKHGCTKSKRGVPEKEETPARGSSSPCRLFKSQNSFPRNEEADCDTKAPKLPEERPETGRKKSEYNYEGNCPNKGLKVKIGKEENEEIAGKKSAYIYESDSKAPKLPEEREETARKKCISNYETNCPNKELKDKIDKGENEAIAGKKSMYNYESDSKAAKLSEERQETARKKCASSYEGNCLNKGLKAKIGKERNEEIAGKRPESDSTGKGPKNKCNAGTKEESAFKKRPDNKNGARLKNCAKKPTVNKQLAGETTSDAAENKRACGEASDDAKLKNYVKKLTVDTQLAGETSVAAVIKQACAVATSKTALSLTSVEKRAAKPKRRVEEKEEILPSGSKHRGAAKGESPDGEETVVKTRPGYGEGHCALKPKGGAEKKEETAHVTRVLKTKRDAEKPKKAAVPCEAGAAAKSSDSSDAETRDCLNRKISLEEYISRKRKHLSAKRAQATSAKPDCDADATKKPRKIEQRRVEVARPKQGRSYVEEFMIEEKLNSLELFLPKVSKAPQNTKEEICRKLEELLAAKPILVEHKNADQVLIRRFLNDESLSGEEIRKVRQITQTKRTLEEMKARRVTPDAAQRRHSCDFNAKVVNIDFDDFKHINARPNRARIGDGVSRATAADQGASASPSSTTSFDAREPKRGPPPPVDKVGDSSSSKTELFVRLTDVKFELDIGLRTSQAKPSAGGDERKNGDGDAQPNVVLPSGDRVNLKTMLDIYRKRTLHRSNTSAEDVENNVKKVEEIFNKLIAGEPSRSNVYEIKRCESKSTIVTEEDLKIHLKKVDGESNRRRRKRFRNLYTADDSEEEAAAAAHKPKEPKLSEGAPIKSCSTDYSVYQSKSQAGVPKLIIKRRKSEYRPETLPYVRLDRLPYIESMVKRRRKSIKLDPS